MVDLKKLRVKVKVAYTPTKIAEILDTSVTGVSGHAYAAPTGVSFEDEDGNTLTKDDVITALTDGSFELIDVEHLGDLVKKGSGDSITLGARTVSFTKLAYSAAVGTVAVLLDSDCRFILGDGCKPSIYSNVRP